MSDVLYAGVDILVNVSNLFSLKSNDIIIEDISILGWAFHCEGSQKAFPSVYWAYLLIYDASLE